MLHCHDEAVCQNTLSVCIVVINVWIKSVSVVRSVCTIAHVEISPFYKILLLFSAKSDGHDYWLRITQSATFYTR